jgi:hypothetical protein
MCGRAAVYVLTYIKKVMTPDLSILAVASGNRLPALN